MTDNLMLGGNGAAIKQATILVMAGGTGGHVMPALTVARRLQSYGQRIEWLGTASGIEAELVPQAGFPITYIKVGGLRGKGKLNQVLAPVKLIVALAQSIRAILAIKPVCVLGMGGFASGPGGLASWLLRKPLVIHEQNAVAGMTNKLLFRFATRVLQAFPDAFSGLDAKHKALTVGNPVREDIQDLAEPDRRMAERNGPARVLVLGGSLGAQSLNQIVPQALALMSAHQRPEVLHQTGKKHLQNAKQSYLDAHVEARIEDFIADMAAAYAWADLVVCRAGALTIAELACAGVGAILIPYPHAVDDHQTKNAEYLKQAGAAMLMPEAELTPQRLAQILSDTLQPQRLLEMAQLSRSLAQPGSADRVAQHCLEVARG